jgi:hypothetical protein
MRPRAACGLRVAGCKPVVKGKYGNLVPPHSRIKAFPVLNHIVMVHLRMFKNFFFSVFWTRFRVMASPYGALRSH